MVIPRWSPATGRYTSLTGETRLIPTRDIFTFMSNRKMAGRWWRIRRQELSSEHVRSSAFRRLGAITQSNRLKAELRTRLKRDSKLGGHYESAESWKGFRLFHDFDRVPGLADERRI